MTTCSFGPKVGPKKRVCIKQMQVYSDLHIFYSIFTFAAFAIDEDDGDKDDRQDEIHHNHDDNNHRTSNYSNDIIA